MSTTEDGGLCLVCDVSIGEVPSDADVTRRCMDCRLFGRTAAFRLRFEVGKVPHRTDWCEDFEAVESLREYYVARGIGEGHSIERREAPGPLGESPGCRDDLPPEDHR